jgi:O-acetyl-ADP-ribose deacetylase (regulator of RNase III)
MQPGKMFVYATGFMMNPKYIINFPTKRGWREKSRIEYIKTGLNDLVNEVDRLRISSIAVPPLGCGLGGLDWHNVKPMIEHAFVKLPEVKIFLFEPAGRPEVKTMVVHNSWLGRA